MALLIQNCDWKCPEGLTDRARNAGQIESEGGMDMAAAIALPDFDSEPARERL